MNKQGAFQGPGLGVPDGGATGDVLTKASDVDQDIEWAPGGGGGGGVTSIIAGAGISVDAATGDVTVTNTGSSGVNFVDGGGGTYVAQTPPGSAFIGIIGGGFAPRAGAGTAVTLIGGSSTDNIGGGLGLVAGNGTGFAGGDVNIRAGTGTPNGNITLPALPTTDPVVSDALWADNGVLVQSGILGSDAQTAVAGAATSNSRNVVVTSEALVAATTYTLTLTNSLIVATSVLQVCAWNTDATGVQLNEISCGAGSAAITFNFAAHTGTIVMNVSVHN